MSKRCTKCGASNEDSRIFCGSCGEPLDADLRLISRLEDQKKTSPVKQSKPEPDPKPVRPKADDDGDYDLGKMAKDKKFNPLPWIILAVVVAAAAIALFVLS